MAWQYCKGITKKRQYLDDLHSMADACQRRGMLFHSEPNYPVYQALQNLSSIVHVCSENLMISSRAKLIGLNTDLRY